MFIATQKQAQFSNEDEWLEWLEENDESEEEEEESADAGDENSDSGEEDSSKEGSESEAKKPVQTEAERKAIAESMKRKAKIAELQAQVDSEKESKASLLSQLAKYKEAEAQAEAQREADELKKLEESKDYQAIIDRMAKKSEEEKQALRNSILNDVEKPLQQKIEELEALANKVSTENFQLALDRDFSSVRDFLLEDTTLTPTIARRTFGDYFEKEDGALVGYSKPKGYSDRVKLVDGSGNPLPFKEALTEMIENDPDRDHLKKSKVAKGAGSDSDGRSSGVKQVPEVGTGQSRIYAALSASKK